MPDSGCQNNLCDLGLLKEVLLPDYNTEGGKMIGFLKDSVMRILSTRLKVQKLIINYCAVFYTLEKYTLLFLSLQEKLKVCLE